MLDWISSRERYGEAFWRAHHEAWQQSVLNQREYCEAHGLPLKAFGNWRAKFKAEPQPPVAPDRDIGRDQRLQCPRAGLGPPFLVGADRRVEQQNGADKGGVGRVPQRQRNHGRDQQQINKRTLELAAKDAGERLATRLRQSVRPVALQPGRRLRFAQPVARRPQLVENRPPGGPL